MHKENSMNQSQPFSILFPFINEAKYKSLGETTCHDLGLDSLVKCFSDKPDEQRLILEVLSHMTADVRVANYRKDVFKDIYENPTLSKKLPELFDRIEFIRNFGSMHKTTDEEIGLWHLYRRLDELKDYILCVEEMHECLKKADIHSEGLIGLRDYVDALYNEARFSAMKKDIESLRVKASDVQSITIGINLNERLEATGLGLISINDTSFKKSGVFSHFSDAISSGDRLHEGTDWDGDMHFEPVNPHGHESFYNSLKNGAGFFQLQRTPFVDARTRSTIVTNAMDESGKNASYYLEKTMGKMMSSLAKNLRDVLTQYADVAITGIAGLIPEFTYYIRLVAFIKKYSGRGFRFCEPTAVIGDTRAEDFYNLKLATTMEQADQMVNNDISFDDSNRIYILTGANRGGKTTLTQALGLLFLMAQGGCFVPAGSFTYRPVDAVYTHFPADEDKTVDLGRLGEECVRFKDIYTEATGESLVLLNETFSTTSFEEGYYIARDSVKALLQKGVRGIYNTHMFKLGMETDVLNDASAAKAVSLVMRTDDGERSFKVEVAPPEGSSFASDIAEKYGVTYEQLTKALT